MQAQLDALVIGAGFSGLGAGAALATRGVQSFAVLEQGDGVGHFWSKTYDRLRLHSPWHDMPNDGGLLARYPKFKSRNDVINYLREYAGRYGLYERLRFGERVRSVKRRATGAGDDGWHIETDRGALHARFVAVATAMNRVPYAPEIRGRADYRGVCIHSAEYRNAAPFRGQSVLVIGSGNSAAEIALDLAENGSRKVQMWVRGPRHFLSLKAFGRMASAMRFLGQMNAAGVDRLHQISAGTPEFEAVVVQRDRMASLFSQDLSRFGIRKPGHGPMRDALTLGRIPVFDQGTARAIRRGKIGVIDGNTRAIESFTEKGVRFRDAEEPFDAVIFGTGFEPKLEEFIADRELLAVNAERGGPLVPVTDGRCRSTVYPSIFFPGFDRTPNGGLSLGRFGWEVGERIADALARG